MMSSFPANRGAAALATLAACSSALCGWMVPSRPPEEASESETLPRSGAFAVAAKSCTEGAMSNRTPQPSGMLSVPVTLSGWSRRAARK